MLAVLFGALGLRRKLQPHFYYEEPYGRLGAATTQKQIPRPTGSGTFSGIADARSPGESPRYTENIVVVLTEGTVEAIWH
jgi:hypothetical protein